jgi:hypothetical protein
MADYELHPCYRARLQRKEHERRMGMAQECDASGEALVIELSAEELLNRMVDRVDKLAEQIYAGIQDYLVGESRMVPWDSLSPRDQGGYRHAARRVLNWQNERR